MLFINPFTYIHSFINLGNIKSLLWVISFSAFSLTHFKIYLFSFFSISWCLLALNMFKSHPTSNNIFPWIQIQFSESAILSYQNPMFHFPFLDNLLERIFYTRLYYFLSSHWNIETSHTETAHPKVINYHHVDKSDRHSSGFILLEL